MYLLFSPFLFLPSSLFLKLNLKSLWIAQKLNWFLQVVGRSWRKPIRNSKRLRNRFEYQTINCTAFNIGRKCPITNSTTFMDDSDTDSQPPPTCPEYFRWIHEDLRPWSNTGITREMLERANRTAHFRLVILNGRVYMEKFHRAFQSRDVFSRWGILQLMRRYPGKLPDLELMFDCEDRPFIKTSEFSGPDAPSPPPLFKYCRDSDTLDIVFPDWSFWGWPEVNLPPWEPLLKSFKEANKWIKWSKREPYAYWKGNPYVSGMRMELLTCNVSKDQDWNARIYAQNWDREAAQKFKDSNLTKQCTHRYKIYIEGIGWSVSQKYILACDSPTLLVKPQFYDFFSRSLIPMEHYWPINQNDKCRSIKFAVDWGNSHEQKAQAIGKAGSRFIQHDLNMDYVYDYMFHLLSEYSKLLTFKPTLPPNARELCPEKIFCKVEGVAKSFITESMVKSPAERRPCTLLPPYDPPSILKSAKRKESTISKVETLERQYWYNNNKSKNSKD
ncbi:hypothetical protein K2173_026598 [Erythroxylum novogranatense]|uniref:Glycosyl transferase CAP10 domain-containing protein n=1 Tax=Erythroxylum novogranatense TaxID=1862640 RepID=A0AAV8TXZ9_9ROSI|nr:hypothetical protein K2173_026598 [Erythroxylum novogranatense]